MKTLSNLGQAFAKAGCRHIILVDRDATGLEETVNGLGLDESQVTARVLDIRDDAEVDASKTR